MADKQWLSAHMAGQPLGAQQLHVPYVGAFAGRDTSKTATGEWDKGDAFWKISCDSLVEWPEAYGPDGKTEISTVSLVERMMAEGWEAAKEWTIKEHCMPRPMQIKELKDQSGNPLDLSVPSIRENDVFPANPEDNSQPPQFGPRPPTLCALWVCVYRHLPVAWTARIPCRSHGVRCGSVAPFLSRSWPQTS